MPVTTYRNIWKVLPKNPVLGALVIICVQAFGVSNAMATTYEELPLEFRSKWEAPIHYHKGTSDIEVGSDFFLAKEAKVNPENELKATLAFFNKSPDNACLYPARYLLIHGEEPPQSCSELEDYKKYVSAQRVKIVFATESTVNPVSSMGHIFILLEGANANGIEKSHAVGFVADSGKESSLFLDFLTDSIQGTYTLKPYDFLIYNYISEEYRSLWEFEVLLTSEEKKLALPPHL